MVESLLRPDGIWLDARIARFARPRPALFLDRDGTIVHDSGYLARAEDVVLLPGAAQMIRAANRAGVPVLVVTNQSGIDRGLFDWDAFAAVESRIGALLAAEGATIDAVAACPFHPDHTPDYGPAHDRWRKPGPGLLEALADGLGVSLDASWMAGDQPRDIEAARRAGLAGALLIGDAAESLTADSAGFRIVRVPDCAAALRALIDIGFLPDAP